MKGGNMETKIIVKYILIGLFTLALCMFAINQTLAYFYKSQFLQGPCELCTTINPRFKSCFITVTKNPFAPSGYESVTSDDLERVLNISRTNESINDSIN